MSLHDALTDWMGDNGWTANEDGRKVSGPDPRDGGRLENIHPTLLIINQLGWEKILGRAEEPTSLTMMVRLELENAEKTPRSDVHKLTRQALDMYHAERRGLVVAAARP